MNNEEKNIYDLIREATEQGDTQRALYYHILSFRDIEIVCPDCSGLGTKSYGNTSTWRHGIGGQAITSGICDKCWGSGDKYRHWTNLKELKEKFNFSFEKWLSKHTYWEDTDTQLIFISTENGGVSITDNEGNLYADGSTLKEACFNYDKSYEKKRKKI